MHRTSRLYVTERARPRTSGVSTAGVGILHVAEWDSARGWVAQMRAAAASADLLLAGGIFLYDSEDSDGQQ